MAYVAGKRLLIGDTYKEPGDPVPEAIEWGNLQAWLNSGHLKEVPDPEPSTGGEAPPPRRKTTTTTRKTTTKKE